MLRVGFWGEIPPLESCLILLSVLSDFEAQFFERGNVFTLVDVFHAVLAEKNVLSVLESNCNKHIHILNFQWTCCTNVFIIYIGNSNRTRTDSFFEVFFLEWVESRSISPCRSPKARWFESSRVLSSSDIISVDLLVVIVQFCEVTMIIRRRRIKISAIYRPKIERLWIFRQDSITSRESCVSFRVQRIGGHGLH